MGKETVCPKCQFLDRPYHFCEVCNGIGSTLEDPDFNEDEDVEFECCAHCDLPDACADFGCAIRQGIKEDPAPEQC